MIQRVFVKRLKQWLVGGGPPLCNDADLSALAVRLLSSPSTSTVLKDVHRSLIQVCIHDVRLGFVANTVPVHM